MCMKLKKIAVHCPSTRSKRSDRGSLMCIQTKEFLKSAWRHGVIDYYDKARNTPYFAPWHFGDRLGVYRWPQSKYKRGFYKSHSRLSKITTGNRCRNIWTMQNVTNSAGYSLKNIHLYYAETRPLYIVHCPWYCIMTSLTASHTDCMHTSPICRNATLLHTVLHNYVTNDI